VFVGVAPQVSHRFGKMTQSPNVHHPIFGPVSHIVCDRFHFLSFSAATPPSLSPDVRTIGDNQNLRKSTPERKRAILRGSYSRPYIDRCDHGFNPQGAQAAGCEA